MHPRPVNVLSKVLDFLVFSITNDPFDFYHPRSKHSHQIALPFQHHSDTAEQPDTGPISPASLAGHVYIQRFQR